MSAGSTHQLVPDVVDCSANASFALERQRTLWHESHRLLVALDANQIGIRLRKAAEGVAIGRGTLAPRTSNWFIIYICILSIVTLTSPMRLELLLLDMFLAEWTLDHVVAAVVAAPRGINDAEYKTPRRDDGGEHDEGVEEPK